MENKQTVEQKRAVWQRVDPTLQPYPPQQSTTQPAVQQPVQQSVDVCCMGTAAQEDIDVIRGQLMRRLAAEEGGHARRLMGVHYLITGQNYSAAVPLPANIPCTGSWREVLRLRYHEESCSGLNYRRASDETTDECLSEILLELSHDEYRHARQLLCLLEKQMPI